MKVKVKNLHTEEYNEMFRDELITIPPGESVEMGRSEANQFLGQFSPMVVDGSGKCIKPKKLKIIEDPEQHAAHRGQPIKFTAPDGAQFRTEPGLNTHMRHLAGELTDDEKRTVNALPRRRGKVSSSGDAKA